MTETTLKPLETRAFKEEDFDIKSHDVGMGLGCENQSTDATNLYVTWFYKDGVERHASYYTGCDNTMSEKIEKFVYELQYKAGKSVAKLNWEKSESRFGVDK